VDVPTTVGIKASDPACRAIPSGSYRLLRDRIPADPV
jgi:hypothetical protein